jgi:hypothetical protein
MLVNVHSSPRKGLVGLSLGLRQRGGGGDSVFCRCCAVGDAELSYLSLLRIRGGCHM